MDVFLYSGDLSRQHDLRVIEYISANKTSEEVMLVVSTPGGSPDAAYKIGRYLQTKYGSVKMFVPGFCKSAGTLLAISADEIIFNPYGELGPLDIQTTKTDNIAGMESGLNIREAFLTLESRAKATFHEIVDEITAASGGVVSFQTASHSAAEIISALYGPVFGRIDPEEVGSRARAMRIGEDYGKRLNQKFKNMRDNAIGFLSQSYSSHGFVIDMQEASLLFNRVRESNSAEKKLCDVMGLRCRIPSRELTIESFTAQFSDILSKEAKDDQPSESDSAKPKRRTRRVDKTNGKDTSTAGGA